MVKWFRVLFQSPPYGHKLDVFVDSPKLLVPNNYPPSMNSQMLWVSEEEQ